MPTLKVRIFPSPKAHEVLVTTRAYRKPFEYIVTGVQKPENLKIIAPALGYLCTKARPGYTVTEEEILEIERQAAELCIERSKPTGELIDWFIAQSSHPAPFATMNAQVVNRLMRAVRKAHTPMSKDALNQAINSITEK